MKAVVPFVLLAILVGLSVSSSVDGIFSNLALFLAIGS